MSSFTLFPTLPTEIRLKIWEQHLLSTPPQIIGIYSICFPDPNEEDFYLGIGSDGQILLESCYPWIHQFIPSRPVPSILHISSEARSLALPSYRLNFQTKNTTNPPPFFPKSCEHLRVVSSQSRKLYYNPSRDLVHYHHFPAAVLSVDNASGELTYISSLPNTCSMWFPESLTLQTPRFVSVAFEMLLDWFGPHSRKPDLRGTEVLGVVIEKDPRHSDYQSLAWRDHQMRIADTDEWEESKTYLEGKILEVVMGGTWKKDQRPKEGGLVVLVCRRLEEVVEEVDGWGSRKVVEEVAKVESGADEGSKDACLVQ